MAVAAAVAGRRARPVLRPARPRESAWTGLGPAASSGCAWPVRGHGRAVAVSAGAAVAVAGIVAALAFGSGIALLLSDPVRTGQAADLALEDAEEADVAKLVVDPRVAAVAVTRSVVARLADGGVLLVRAETQRLGELPAGLVSGRLPEGPTEIALSPRIAAARGLNVGDTLTVVNRNGRPLPLTVTGTVAVVDDGGHLGTSNVVTDAALGGLARTSPIVRAEIVATRDRRARSPPNSAATWRSCPARSRRKCATSPTWRGCRRSSRRRSPWSRGRRWRTPSSPRRATTPGR